MEQFPPTVTRHIAHQAGIHFDTIEVQPLILKFLAHQSCRFLAFHPWSRSIQLLTIPRRSNEHNMFASRYHSMTRL
jgi:hypothetical protein